MHNDKYSVKECTFFSSIVASFAYFSASIKMARRLLDAARAAKQLADWSDLESNISDDEDTVESEDSENEMINHHQKSVMMQHKRVWMIHLLSTAKTHLQA